MTIGWLLAAVHLLALGVGLGAYLHNHLFWAKLGLLAARISFGQAVLVVLMVLAATAMARGYGVPAR